MKIRQSRHLTYSINIFFRRKHKVSYSTKIISFSPGARTLIAITTYHSTPKTATDELRKITVTLRESEATPRPSDSRNAFPSFLVFIYLFSFNFPKFLRCTSYSSSFSLNRRNNYTDILK